MKETFNLTTLAHVKAFSDYVKGDSLPAPIGSFDGNTLVLSYDTEEFRIPSGVLAENEKNRFIAWVSTLSDQLFDLLKTPRLIFGKNTTERIASCEVEDDVTHLFIEEENGTTRTKAIENAYWIMSSVPYDKSWNLLDGSLHYKHIKFFPTKEAFSIDKKKYGAKDIYSVYDAKEAAMLLSGFTYFKGMKVSDVSVLSFDIETTGIVHDSTSKVLLISNTFRRNGVITKKLFAYDDYACDADFFEAWCAWVKEMNPAIICGHNIFGFDLPYLNHCAQQTETELRLGRNESSIRFENFESKFRKDGSQDYKYKRCHIYGREIVDTMFLSYHYDFSRKYESYSLKNIIKQEGLEKEDRQFYDASTIRTNYLIPEEWVKIKAYCVDDSDDALALYSLMIPSYFYLNQSVPKSFQSINYTASGAQINSLLIRSYLQEGHSIPKASAVESFEGALSDGYPGIYNEVFKVDVASLYPSVMLQYEIYDKKKDPNMHFLKMVKYFTKQRLEDKKKAKETGDSYYKDLEQSRKITINSAYGLLGAMLHFNSPANAALVTKYGRDILTKAIQWAEAKTFKIVNLDTDSISFCKADMDKFSEEEQVSLLSELNALYPNQIHWEHDGIYTTLCVVKAKNYILYDGKKIKTKGSALKATMKEKALVEFINKVIETLVFKKGDGVDSIYQDYVKEVHNLTDIKRWCSKKTITDSVLNPKRTNEQKILAAIGDKNVQMGDKIFVYFDNEENLKLQEHWNNDHNKKKLVGKIFNTISVFEPVLNMDQFPDYTLKRNKAALETLLGVA